MLPLLTYVNDWLPTCERGKRATIDRPSYRLLLMKKMKIFMVWLLSLACIGNVMAIEEPQYEVVLTDGAFEIRKYAPYLVAETLVDGDMDEASNKGFRLIADYIFGNNQVPNSSATEKIAMTAPVKIEPQSAKIAMTAPVTLAPQQDVLNMQTTKQWVVQFVMPNQYTLASIPKPKNQAVRLKEVPSKNYAVLKYSGFNTQSKVQAKTVEASEWVLKKNLKAVGAPQLSRYDPPWTLPMLRRNEIMIEISAP